MRETGFGALLQHHRLAARLTQEALAERTGLSARGISDLERGVREFPRRETLQLLLQALDLTPAERATMIATARRPPLATRTPARASQPSGLPLPLTSLIGREAEVAAVAQLLPEPSLRLLTLTGPGGTGKTRLALAAAERAAPRFPDGVAFVPLAPLADPSLVAAAIAQGLGVREAAGQTLLQAITAYLCNRRVLLILDNCEHVLAAAPVVAELLGGSRGLTILATSRVRLRISGEREVPVSPLALPEVGGPQDCAALALVPAVNLLIARAQDANPAFSLSKDNASDVAEICRRLDGLPLALELAAARLKILSPAALLARLDRRLPLLTGGARDLPDRQQTLRQTIAWSHDLLSEEERMLFRRLGVFAGGWTLEAAEMVANSAGGLDIFDELTSLVDKSLVRLDDHDGAELRFTMLETIREFALDCLVEDTGEAQSIRRAHAHFYAQQALAAWNDLTVGNPAAVNRFRAEEANLRLTMAYLLDTGEHDTALRLIGGSMSEYWTVSGGQFTEARGWLDRALRQGGGEPPAVRAWGLYGLTVVAAHQGDWAAGRRAGAEGLDMARASGEPLLRALVAFVLSLVEEFAGEAPVPEALVLEAVAAARAAGHPGTLGWILMALGRLRLTTGDITAARAAADEALRLHRACDGAWGICDTLVVLAAITRAEGDHAGAARWYAESLRLRQESGLFADVYGALIGVAALAQESGLLAPAARLLGAEYAYVARFGYDGFGDVVPHREQLRQPLVEQLGTEHFQRQWEAGSTLSIDEAISEALALTEVMAAEAM
ncbi:MAG: helix-turn-helix domain-containing protein [Thermomicrobiales bacterium]